jgi:hypothetical protein
MAHVIPSILKLAVSSFVTTVTFSSAVDSLLFDRGLLAVSLQLINSKVINKDNSDLVKFMM